MYDIKSKIRKTLKQHGFTIAAEMIELDRFNSYALRKMLATWENYPKCMDIYPTHLLVKREYVEGM